MHTYFKTIVFCLYSTIAFSQITENFDHNDIQISKSNCWQFSNAVISKPPASKSINVGYHRGLGDIPLTGSSGSATILSPYVQMNGSGFISFNHKLLLENGQYSDLKVEIFDPSGLLVQSGFTHVYRSNNVNMNGNPRTTVNSSIPITYSGYGQVVFTWTWQNANNNAYIDDIQLDGIFAADSSLENNGYCPALMAQYDTLCMVQSKVAYSALYATALKFYNWRFMSKPAGQIDQSASQNNETVNVNYDTLSGDYILNCMESGTSHQTVFYIHIIPWPELSYTIDTICLGSPVTFQLQLTGSAPWQVKYIHSGISSPTTMNIQSATQLISLPASTTGIMILELNDRTGCPFPPSLLPVINVPYFPGGGKPGPIYH